MKRFLVLWLILILLSWPLVPARAARTFADGTYLGISSALVSTPPFTMCAWVYATVATTTMEVMGVVTAASNDHSHVITVQDDNGIQVRSRSTVATIGAAQSSTAWAANAWTAICGVWVSTTSRFIYVNGAGKVENTTTVTPAGMNRTFLARSIDGAEGREWNGPLGQAAIWSAALTDAEILAFANKVHPRRIRPVSLVACPHVHGDQSPEPDQCAATGWTLTGSPAKATLHPPVGLFSMSFGR